ncbi:MAG TPA: adenosylcobinamide-GDP ribazoletransferase [Methanobacteriaceae archaeon]|nr:adenosylcobinamide-GDP ribazoletransferase [Methanobacteriaceae archaeon]
MSSKARLDAPVRKGEMISKGNRTPVWRGFLGLVSFSTILPLNIHTSILEMARFTWMWPLIGGFIGIMVGAVAWVVTGALHLPQLLSASLIYAFSIIITGLHHLDGLIDFGDGIMGHGDTERRIEIMKDQRIGTGGLSSLLITSLITLTALSVFPIALLIPIVIVAEIAAKLGLVTCATFSRPSGKGTGTYFVENMTPGLLGISLTICILLGYSAMQYAGVAGIAGGVIMGIFMAFLARWKFKYTTGDVLGATNELSRMSALLAMVLILTMW